MENCKRFTDPTHNELCTKISKLGSFLSKRSVYDGDSWSPGLDLMGIIDSIMIENGYSVEISEKELNQFNKGLEILKKTKFPTEIITKKLKDTPIEQRKLVKDESGNYHYINKLNTNYNDLSELITEMLVRGLKYNPENVNKIISKIQNNPKEALLELKPYLKKLIEQYFIKRGAGLSDFMDFTKNIENNSKKGEESENKVKEFLLKNGFNLEYQGGNGDFIDMIFGVDLIMSRSDFGYVTIQVKSNFPSKLSVKHYHVDFIGVYDGNNCFILDRTDMSNITNEIRKNPVVNEVINKLTL